MPTLKRKPPLRVAQLSIFIFSAFQLRTRSHATRRFQSKPFLVSLARSSRRFREATARAFKPGTYSSPPPPMMKRPKLIHARIFFLPLLRSRRGRRVQSVNIDASVRKTGLPVRWRIRIFLFEARVFFGNALSRIEDKFGKWELRFPEILDYCLVKRFARCF